MLGTGLVGQLLLVAMMTRASAFLASSTVAVSFGGQDAARSSLVGSFKQCELSGVGSVCVGSKTSALWGSSSLPGEVKRVAVVVSFGKAIS